MELIMRLSQLLLRVGRYSAVLILAAPESALAHGDFLYMPQAKVQAGIYLSAQDKGIADDNLWQIPGVLMGGEAKGNEAGFAINDANIRLTWANQDGVFAHTEVSAHGHENDLEAKIEQAFGGYHWTNTLGHIKLEGGKMKGAFSLQNPLHPSDRNFTDASLPYQAFLGDHFSDAGARAQFMTWHGEKGLSTFGTELWRGDSFPANKQAEGPAWDVFARYQHTEGRVQLTVGGWYFRSEANERKDDRTEGGHSHGAATTTANTRFSGDTQISGLETQALWKQSDTTTYVLEGELLLHNSNGLLQDNTRQSNAELKQQGYSLSLGGQYLNHQLALRYSALKINNILSGAGSTILGSDARLDANAHRPERLDLSYQYTWHNGLAFRAEFVSDSSTKESLNYGRVSMLWDGTVWKR